MQLKHTLDIACVIVLGGLGLLSFDLRITFGRVSGRGGEEQPEDSELSE